MNESLCTTNVIVYILQVRVGYNDGKSGPSEEKPNINVFKKSYTKKNGLYTCNFTVDARMTFTKPGRLLKV